MCDRWPSNPLVAGRVESLLLGDLGRTQLNLNLTPLTFFLVLNWAVGELREEAVC